MEQAKNKYKKPPQNPPKKQTKNKQTNKKLQIVKLT